MDSVTAYPLTWPSGQPRTPQGRRSWASFDRERTLAVARDEMLAELGRLGAKQIVISSNLRLRNDGLPAANQGRPSDTGVAVYFQLQGQPHVLACDRWIRVEDNMWAIRLHVEALRGTERWGVGRTHQVFTGYRALPAARTDQAMTVEDAARFLAEKASPEFRDCWTLIAANRTALDDSYRLAAKRLHPDAGGDHEAFIQLQEARRVLDAHHQRGGK